MSASHDHLTDTFSIRIEGMSCASCVLRIERALNQLTELSAEVNLATESALIRKPKTLATATIVEIIEKTGFKVAQQELNLKIKGMSCASCVARIERAFEKSPEVIHAEVNLATEQLRLQTLIGFSQQQATEIVQRTGFEVQSEQIILNIEGMSCASCSARVEKALNQVSGVQHAYVNLAQEQAYIDGGEITALIGAVERAGFKAHLLQTEQNNTAQIKHQQQDELKRDFYLAVILALPVFLLEMGGHLIPSVHHFIAQNIGLQNSWYIQWVLTTLVLCIPGRRFYQKGIPALLKGHPDMNALVSVGTFAAYSYSVVATFFPTLLPEGTVNVYFEAAAVIIALILLGRFLEARAKGKTSQAIQYLVGLQPKTARVLQAGQWVEIPIAKVQRGAQLEIRPGEKIPVDGRVLEGRSYIDESMISGEPLAVEKTQNSKVIGGTLNQNGHLRIEATDVGEHSTLANIIQMVERAQGAKLPIQHLVDRVTLWFVPAVIGIALLTFILWFIFGPEPSLSFALVNAVAVLIIACPCAMGLATPTSIMVGTGRAAELGVLFRKGEALQQLKSIQIVAVDKTGTLTEGKPQLTDFFVTEDFDEQHVLQYVASVEAKSEHPIAHAIVQAAQDLDIPLLEVSDFTALTGSGIQANIAAEQVFIGASRMMLEKNYAVQIFADQAKGLAEQGKTPIYVAIAGQLAALIAVSDPIKASSFAAVDALHQQGLKVAMITGDHHVTAQAVAAQLNIDHVVAEVRPDEKVSAVQDLQQQGKVAFVGDGINDAPALAQSDVGIAIGTGTDIAIEAADVVLMSGNMQGVSTAIELSHATIKNIQQNLFWAFLYNIILIPVAAGILYPSFQILMSPIFAAAAMALSSVFVLTNALRLRYFQPQQQMKG
jgi:P-type Cu+ transporter